MRGIFRTCVPLQILSKNLQLRDASLKPARSLQNLLNHPVEQCFREIPSGGLFQKGRERTKNLTCSFRNIFFSFLFLSLSFSPHGAISRNYVLTRANPRGKQRELATSNWQRFPSGRGQSDEKGRRGGIDEGGEFCNSTFVAINSQN